MHLEVVPDGEWASRVGDRLEAHVRAEPNLNLCLPTGDTPRAAYADFAARDPNLSGVKLFLLDEFVLPPGSPGRCDVMLERDLLSRLARPPSRLVRWDVDSGLDEAPRLMEETIRRDGGLDLALLGLGMNGHIGTNEPGSDRDSRSRLVQLDSSTADGAIRYGSRERPAKAVTMGIGTLLEAAELWLLVSGKHKAPILARTVSGPIGEEVPATFLRGHPNATVIADESSAALLEAP